MCAYKDNSNLDQLKKREYLKQQHQLRTMTKTTTSLSADDMIENLLSKKEIFKMKKDPISQSKNKSGQVKIPYWLMSGQEPAIYKRVWDIVGTPTGFADTPKLTNILLTSRLTTDVLGYIWSLSNSNLGPALLQNDTYTALALVALAQGGYGFTSSAVLNTLKEAPIPIIELNFNEGTTVMSGMTMTAPEVPTSVTMSSLSPIVTLSVCPQMNSTPASTFTNPMLSSVTSQFASKSTTPIATSPVAPIAATNFSANLLADSLSLLDLDMPSSDSLPKAQLTTAPVTSSILDNEHTFVPISDASHIPKVQQSSSEPKDLGQGFISPQPFVSLNNIQGNEKNNAKETEVSEIMDDLFGDFQSVEFPQENKDKDDIEFDDFKSADFTPLTLLEVKEKPPETNLVKSFEPETSSQEKTPVIEDLFPKCIVKPKENGEDLLAEEEDKYSALRSLAVGDDYDEFGDFLTAAPVQPSTTLPPLVEYQANIQEKAMEACIDILEEAKKIFHSIDEEEVLIEVTSDPRGVQYLEELIEVERIAQRLQVALNKENFSLKLEELSKELLQYLEPHKNSYMEEESGPKCGICLSERGPAYVKYGINNFHAPCANLYLHKVDANLPIAPVM